MSRTDTFEEDFEDSNDEDTALLDRRRLIQETEANRSDLEKQMRTHLTVLQRCPPSAYVFNTNQQPMHTGNLWKQRRSGEWKRFYFVLTDTTMAYYKHRDDTKPRRTFPIAYVTSEEIEVSDSLADMQAQENVDEVCKYRITLYSSDRVYLLAADNNEEAEKWIEALNTALENHQSQGERDEKAVAAKELEPLLKEQRRMEVDHLLEVVNSLVASGLTSPVKPTFQGKMELLVDGEWIKYYFMLADKVLTYYVGSRKDPPVGNISITHAAIIIEDEWDKTQSLLRDIVSENARPSGSSSGSGSGGGSGGARGGSGSSNNAGNSQDDGGASGSNGANEQEEEELDSQQDSGQGGQTESWGQGVGSDNDGASGTGSMEHTFSIQTPLATFTLRCKHTTALRGWVEALEAEKDGRARTVSSNSLPDSGNSSGSGTGSVNDTDVVRIDRSWKRVLSVLPDMSPSVVLKNDSQITVGRSSACDLVVVDEQKQVSRQHISVSCEGDVVVLHDLGSSKGTFVNSQQYDQYILAPNDVIRLGSTIELLFEAKPPKKLSNLFRRKKG